MFSASLVLKVALSHPQTEKNLLCLLLFLTAELKALHPLFKQHISEFIGLPDCKLTPVVGYLYAMLVRGDLNEWPKAPPALFKELVRNMPPPVLELILLKSRY